MVRIIKTFSFRNGRGYCLYERQVNTDAPRYIASYQIVSINETLSDNNYEVRAVRGASLLYSQILFLGIPAFGRTDDVNGSVAVSLETSTLRGGVTHCLSRPSCSSGSVRKAEDSTDRLPGSREHHFCSTLKGMSRIANLSMSKGLCTL